jgi:hypothetical protein
MSRMGRWYGLPHAAIVRRSLGCIEWRYNQGNDPFSKSNYVGIAGMYGAQDATLKN